jgi:uncharacterized SAM-binding protein YcdF (DUF218 family)
MSKAKINIALIVILALIVSAIVGLASLYIVGSLSLRLNQIQADQLTQQEIEYVLEEFWKDKVLEEHVEE